MLTVGDFEKDCGQWSIFARFTVPLFIHPYFAIFWFVGTTCVKFCGLDFAKTSCREFRNERMLEARELRDGCHSIPCYLQCLVK